MPEFTPLSELMLKTWDAVPVVAGLFGEVPGTQFFDDVSALTTELTHRPEKRWALCLRDSYNFSAAFMAAANADKTLILPGNLQPDALKEIADGYDAIIDDDFFQSLENGALFDFQPLDLDAITLTLYSSGSSGVPKPIKKTLTLLSEEVQTLEKLWGSQLKDSLIAGTVSHQHIYGLLFRILWSLCAGRPFERSMREHPEQVAVHGGSDITLISSPALLKRLETESKPTHYRAVFSSGGALPFSASALSRKKLNTTPIEVFGSTETGGIAYRASQVENTPWALFPSHTMKLNADRCLCIRSAFTGIEGWYETADRCRILSDRTFVLEGRADRVVKVEEKRISLPEIENHLQALEWIGESVALPLEQDGRQTVGAVITLTDAGKNKIAETGRGRFWIQLRKELRRSIEPVAIPRRYRVVEHIPLNPQGKHSLPEMQEFFKESTNDEPKLKPTIISEERSENGIILKMRVDEDIEYFKGHFNSFQLLPGVAQVDWAVHYGTTMLNTPTVFQGMEVIKFFKPLQPGSEVELELTWKADKQKLQFLFLSSEGKYSSGRILLSEA